MFKLTVRFIFDINLDIMVIFKLFYIIFTVLGCLLFIYIYHSHSHMDGKERDCTWLHKYKRLCLTYDSTWYVRSICDWDKIRSNIIYAFPNIPLNFMEKSSRINSTTLPPLRPCHLKIKTRRTIAVDRWCCCCCWRWDLRSCLNGISWADACVNNQSI